MTTPLIVRVTRDIVLDLGSGTAATAPDGSPLRVIEPPTTPLIQQLIAHLEQRELQVPSARRVTRKDEARALTALTVRWGSWFAVLVDRNLPQWSEAGKDGVSRIEQDEMARINVEASFALATLIEMKRGQPERYDRVIRVTLEALPPLPGRGTRDATSVEVLLSLNRLQVKAQVPALRVALQDSPELAAVDAHPARVFANAAIHACWRTGPVEDIHSGEFITCPLRRRRITEAEERDIIGTTWGRMVVAVEALEGILADDERTLADKVLPLVVGSETAATRWTLTEASRTVVLGGEEP